jgi:hypothetical protein
VKSLKGLVKEMATNPIASVFLVKIVSSYDDTPTMKKYVVNDLVTNFEELVEDEVALKIYIGILNPKCKQIFSPPEAEALSVSEEDTTSRKDPDNRLEEVLGALGQEIARFLEEKMSLYVNEKSPILLREMIRYSIKTGAYEDLLEQFYRDLKRKVTFESSTSKGQLPLIAHPNTHRLVKDLVIYESGLDQEEKKFSETISGILKKDLDLHLKERSGFIILAYLERENMKSHFSDLKAA